jgi:hypothetical protein
MTTFDWIVVVLLVVVPLAVGTIAAELHARRSRSPWRRPPSEIDLRRARW